MYKILEAIEEQQRKLKGIFIINGIIVLSIYGLLLYFSIHVSNTASASDTTSKSLAIFFIIISIFAIINVIFSFIYGFTINKRSQKFFDNLKHFAINNKSLDEDLSHLSPDDFLKAFANSTNDEELIQALKNLINKN